MICVCAVLDVELYGKLYYQGRCVNEEGIVVSSVSMARAMDFRLDEPGFELFAAVSNLKLVVDICVRIIFSH